MHPEADCVIKPDVGRPNSAYNSYRIYTYGEMVAREPTLAGAKKYVEEVYGPLNWVKLPGDQALHYDRVWGETSEFNAAPYYLVVDHLPRLGSVRSAVSKAAARWTD